VNLGEASIVLRHRPALEVVDLTLRFVRSVAPKQVLFLCGIVLLPLWIGLVALRAVEIPWALLWCAGVVAVRIAEIPFTVLYGHLLFERDVTLKVVFLQSVRVLGRVLVGFAIYAVLMVLSVVLIFGPLFIGANYFFLPEVLILEKAGPFRAFKRSHQFLAGRSGTGMEGLMFRTGLMLAFIVLAETLGQSLVRDVLAVHVELEDLWGSGGSPLALFGLLVFVPYGAAHRFLAYTNERTRQDGWDIQIAFLNLASRGEHRSRRDARHAA